MSLSRKSFSRFCAAASPGVHVSRNPDAQSGPRRLQVPGSQVLGGDLRAGCQRLWRGQGWGWVAEAQDAFPEWCEHAQTAAFLVAQACGSHQQVAGKAARCDADAVKGGRHLALSGRLTGDVALVPMDRRDKGLLREVRDHLCSSAPAQDQRLAAFSEACVQAPQRLGEPPARRAADWTSLLRAAFFVQHIKADERCAALDGSMQGWMIGKSQIVTEPDEQGGRRKNLSLRCQS